ncbi:MAG: HAD-IA family hydrolase [bacterium]
MDSNHKGAEGVLLDFDGTLTRPALDWPAMKEEMRLGSGEVSILDYLPTLSPERAREVAAILDRHERAAAERAEPNEGAAELVAYLERSGLPFGVVTNNAMRHVRPMLERIGIRVEIVITRDIGIWKPDPRMVLAGAAAIGAPPERCVLIGDGRYDMMAARAAGMTSLLLSPAPGPACDHRVARLGEAIPLLEKLRSRK